jgi:hypothetical protein
VVVTGAADVDGLVVDEAQAPTATVAVKMSRASNSLTMASSFRGSSPR